MSSKNRQTFVILLLLVAIRLVFGLFGMSVESTRLFGAHSFTPSLQLLPLQLTTAIVFIWYAIGHMASGLEFNGIGNRLLQKLNRTQQVDFTKMAKVFGVFEFLVAASFVIGFYVDVFSLIASLILFLVILAYYLANSSFLIRDLAILGGALSLFLLSLS